MMVAIFLISHAQQYHLVTAIQQQQYPRSNSIENNREIISLNSTTFSPELIQHEHPFPHIKLIEYYLSYCGICLKFKPTFIELAHEIFPWRNVIRTAAIDLGVSSNSPIAHSWSIDVVPTLLVHPPPPSVEFSAKLAKQLSSVRSAASSSPSPSSSYNNQYQASSSDLRDLQKSMFEEYNGTRLMINKFEVIKYTSNDASAVSMATRKAAQMDVSDKVELLKSDLLEYIERLVRTTTTASNQFMLPSTWPNLRQVQERSLSELHMNHPRQELFLIIEAPTSAKNAGLRLMLELSSSAAWQAIRYVRASENRELIEDVIAYKRKELNLDVAVVSGEQKLVTNNDQLELLNNLINPVNKQTEGNNNNNNDNNNNIILVHIDYSHSTEGLASSAALSSPSASSSSPSKVPFITVVTSTDLASAEQSASLYNQQQYLAGSANNNNKVKRAINQIKTSGYYGYNNSNNQQQQQQHPQIMQYKQQPSKRSLFGATDTLSGAESSSSTSTGTNSDGPAASLKRKLDQMALYIGQTYTETKEDREFVKALTRLDENPTSSDLKHEVKETVKDFVEDINERRNRQQQRASWSAAREGNNISGGANGGGEDSSKTNNGQGNTLAGLINRASDSLMSFTTSTTTASTTSSSAPSSSTSSSSFLSFSSNGKNNNNNIDNLINDQDPEDDYDDKLKAIRYIFLSEVPRKSLLNTSLTEKQDKLNTLLNLVSVIKAYFPLPDAASVQFIDGIQSYLQRQQQTLLELIQLQQQQQQQSPQSSNSILGFDTRALKLESKRLEAEGKRLPEIKNWKHCKFGGYSCALWRLFHTLTAFEFKKLNQIEQLHSTGPSRQQQQQQYSTSTNNGENQSETLQQQPKLPIAESLSSAPTTTTNEHTPVERLISPPSTTTSLSLTIATTTTSQHGSDLGINNNSSSSNNRRQHELDLLPTPVLLVMRDYVTQFYSCEECARKFQFETKDLSLERIRSSAEFSLLWLWETHNRVSKRLSVNPTTNPVEHPKKWFPAYNQCQRCYLRAPSYLKETNLELPAIFHESIEWNKNEIITHLLCQYTRQPMDNLANIFGYQVPNGVVVIVACALVLIILLRCASYYIERQRRYKASLLNNNGYSAIELQRNNC